MSDPINPNSEYLLDEDKHRFVFKALRLENAEMAHAGEFVIDISNGILYIKGEDGLLHSKAAEVGAELQALKDAGVIQSALAYENNSEVYSLYVRENKCRLSEMLKLSKNIRYYAVRGVTQSGTFQYITGNLVNGNIENVLVDVEHIITDPNMVYTGTGRQGTLHTPSEVLDGHPYFIDFFDSNRVIISTVPCQVVYTQQMDFSLAPEKNIISLSIATNQDMLDEITFDPLSFLYQGQDPASLNIYVTANYADGTSRYINHELATSRLTIELPFDADSDEVGSEFDITAKYFTEELNTGDESSGYNDVNYASITATRKVRIVPDVYTGVKYLLPVPMVRGAGGISEIFPKIFAFYENNSIEDVTVNSRLAIGNGFYSTAFGVSQVFDVSLGLGNGGTVYTENAIRLTMSEGNKGQWALLQVARSPITQNQNKSFECCIAKFDTISNPGTIKMRLQRNFVENFVNVSAFNDLGKVMQQDGSYKVPTHFRVRSVIDSSFYYTIVPIPTSQWNLFTIEDSVDISKKLSGFSANNGNIPYPVLVEFLTYDEATQKFTNLSMHPFFTQSQIIV